MPGRTGKAPRRFRRLLAPGFLYHELIAGCAAYDAHVGRWWHWRSTDPAHARAYRAIADHLESAQPEPPKTIVDYGCGSGSLLTRLYTRFPQSRLIGLDGSSLLLRIARQRFRRLDRDWAERVKLIERRLPDFSLPLGVADVAILCFPHIVPERGEGLSGGAKRGVSKADMAVARVLAVTGEPHSDPAEAADSCEDLLRGKTIARNLRGLLRRGGLCVRVEYTDLERERSPFIRQRSAFEAGALEEPVGGRRAQRLFRLVRSTYVRSKVVEDVYQQTGDEADGRGGYSITLLKAR